MLIIRLKTAGTFLIALGLLLPAVAPAQNTALTAAVAPASPTVGVTEVIITGTASAGAKIIDTATFPDGSVNEFSIRADAAGAYTSGPFVLEQLGTYHDALRDDATGASTTLSYSGVGDFTVAVEPASATIRMGAEARFKVTITSVGGFGGEVIPGLPTLPDATGIGATWSSSELKVPPDGSATTILTILTLVSTPAGTYEITPQGVSGSVTHAVEPAIGLTVAAPPPDTITAAFGPADPIVGLSAVAIKGKATAGNLVIDNSTFPDGVTHQFFIKSTGAGTYIDGPFTLGELGTYHDVLMDGATGATTEISYQGVGDFSAAVDQNSQTAARGQEAKFQVTFKSLSGFGGAITPAVPDLSKIPGATASWSQPSVTVHSGESIGTGLTIKLSTATPAGTYTLTVTGTNGSVTHTSDISLTVQ